MNKTEVLQKLQDIIVPYLDKPCEIQMEMSLRNDLQINSVDIVNIICEIEEVFKCTISIDQLIEVDSVKKLVQYIIETGDK